MLLQNTLDLSTFEIVRFRIWNQTSQPSDRGFGSKYFNTNSGHEAYCREEIFTPIGWRTAAYLDDIDKINEKLDLIFGDELDTDTIIDSWKEVQDFLSGIEDTKNLMTMLDGKAEWNKNISSDSFKAIGYGATGANGWKFNGPALSFGANSTYYAQLQINYQADQVVFRRHTNEGFTEWQTILHSGNVGDYTLVNRGNKGAIDFNNVLDSGFEYTSGSSTNNGKNYGVLATFRVSDSIWQIVGGGDIETLLYRSGRGNSSSWGDWKTIAFTDSTVAAAYKLKNPSTNGDVVTITEEGNVLVGSNDNTLSAKLKSTGLTHVAGVSSTPVLGNVTKIGLAIGSSVYGMQQWVEGTGQSNIQVGRFDGTATAYALNLNPLGGAVNVGEGGLNVTGDITLGEGVIYGPTGLNAITTSKANLSIGYGYRTLQTDIYGGRVVFRTGETAFNAMLINASGNVTIGTGDYAAETYAFYVHKSLPSYFSNRVLIGGAEDDGSTDLQVKGKISLTDAIESNGQEMLRRYDVGLYLGQGTAVQGGLPTNIFGKEIRFLNSGGTRTLVISDEGLATFNGGALIPTGQTLTIGSVTFRETAVGEVEVDGNLHTTGTLASGGKAQEGTGSTGGASGTIREFTIDPPTDDTSSFKLEHSFNTEKVIVQIFELNGNSGKYEMILTDVEITDANNVTVTFGRKPTEYHKVYVIA